MLSLPSFFLCHNQTLFFRTRIILASLLSYRSMPRETTGALPAPPPVGTRSPSECYIRYLLTLDSDKTIQELALALARDGVVLPPGEVEYLDSLDKQIQDAMPDPFKPLVMRHGPSQDFLQEQGIWSMWHPDRAVQEARAIFKDPVLREHVCAILTMQGTPTQVRDLLLQGFGRNFLHESIKKFQHYFWRLELLTMEEKERLLHTAQNASVLLSAYGALGRRSVRSAVLASLGYTNSSVSMAMAADDAFQIIALKIPELMKESASRAIDSATKIIMAATHAQTARDSIPDADLDSVRVELQKGITHRLSDARSAAELGTEQFKPGLKGRLLPKGNPRLAVVKNGGEDHERAGTG